MRRWPRRPACSISMKSPGRSPTRWSAAIRTCSAPPRWRAPGRRATPGRHIRLRSGQAKRELRAATMGSWTTCRWRCPRSYARPSCNGVRRGSASTGRDATQVLDKLDEEIAEVRAELEQDASAERLSEEIGDLLFAAVNLARHLDVDGESGAPPGQRQVRAPLSRDRGGAARPRAPPRGRLARRDGGALAGRESEGALTVPRHRTPGRLA